LAAGFLDVFLAAGFFTESPRNGTARLGSKAHRAGGPGFGRRGL